MLLDPNRCYLTLVDVNRYPGGITAQGEANCWSVLDQGQGCSSLPPPQGRWRVKLLRLLSGTDPGWRRGARPQSQEHPHDGGADVCGGYDFTTIRVPTAGWRALWLATTTLARLSPERWETSTSRIRKPKSRRPRPSKCTALGIQQGWDIQFSTVCWWMAMDIYR